MKWILPWLAAFISLNSIGQCIAGAGKLSADHIYIFCRATYSKAGLIAHGFNYTDTNITHIGIGFIKNNRVLIYNVTDNIAGETALQVDSLGSFAAPGEVYYISIWECDNTPEELERARQICAAASTRSIFFDASFTIADDDTLYCSEFCAAVLKAVNPCKFRYSLRLLVLRNALYKSFLQRKMLLYYPVDFFQQDDRFKKIFECRIKR